MKLSQLIWTITTCKIVQYKLVIPLWVVKITCGNVKCSDQVNVQKSISLTELLVPLHCFHYKSVNFCKTLFRDVRRLNLTRSSQRLSISAKILRSDLTAHCNRPPFAAIGSPALGLLCNWLSVTPLRGGRVWVAAAAADDAAAVARGTGVAQVATVSAVPETIK